MFHLIFLIPVLVVLLLGILCSPCCAADECRRNAMITLNYHDARPIYEQVCDGLRRLIVSGAIADGDKLPSVRALATQLAINPNTIQRAYNELESSGYCCSVPGKGCFAVHTYRAQDDARRLSLEHQLKELLQELRAMGVSEEDIQALCREGEAK